MVIILSKDQYACHRRCLKHQAIFDWSYLLSSAAERLSQLPGLPCSSSFLKLQSITCNLLRFSLNSINLNCYIIRRSPTVLPTFCRIFCRKLGSIFKKNIHLRPDNLKLIFSHLKPTYINWIIYFFLTNSTIKLWFESHYLELWNHSVQ